LERRNGKVKISEANTSWRTVSNTANDRETAAELRHAYTTTLMKLGIEKEKG
jgi:hypothetical protein